MTPVTRPLAAIAAMAIFLAGCVPLKQIQEERLAEFREAVRTGQLPFTVPPGSSVDTILVSDTARSVTIRMSREFSHVPYRRNNVRQINSSLSAFFEEAYEGYSIAVETLGMPLEELIPNFYRASREEYDLSRLPNVRSPRPEPILEIISKPLRPTAGLSRRTIGLWHSHGWYYDRTEDRWEWQRPRLFQSVEDLGPMSYTLPYLVPMLENAGARVFLPRERDTQRHEVVVDNDTPGAAYRETTSGPAWKTCTCMCGEANS